jgi:hypothetical protein
LRLISAPQHAQKAAIESPQRLFDACGERNDSIGKVLDLEQQEPRLPSRMADYIPPFAKCAKDGAPELMRLVRDKQRQQQKEISPGMTTRKAKATAKSKANCSAALVFAFDEVLGEGF